MNWLFMDMNSYFASVEQYLRPELRNRPIGVVPVETDSTCVIAASNEAKRYGVKTGTGVRAARQMCPRIKFVQARPKVYVRIHHQVKEKVEECAPICRVYSIDEWSIQLRGDDQRPERTLKLAREIKEKLFKEFGPWMTSSIGIATSRLLAKMASDLKKPDGLTLLPVSDLPGRLEHWSLQDLCGIGKRMTVRLEQHGIQTIRDLWEISQEEAIQIWGSISGAQWWAGFHGIDEPEAPTRRQSMSHGKVLEPQLRNEEGAYCTVIKLVCRLGQRLRQTGYYANTLHLSVRDVQGGRFFEKAPLPCIHDTPTMLQQLSELWGRRVPNGLPIKKVDVCASGLVLASQVPRSLFDEMERPRRISLAMDRVNEKCGAAKMYLGSIHHYRDSLESKIAFGRIPAELPGEQWPELQELKGELREDVSTKRDWMPKKFHSGQ